MRSRLIAASLGLALSLGLLSATEAPVSAKAGDYLNVVLTNTPDGNINVHWDKANGSKVTHYEVFTSTARLINVDVQSYSSNGPDVQDLVVPHAVGVTPNSGDYTFVKVRVFRSNGHNAGTPAKWIKPTPIAPPATGTQVTLGTFNVRLWTAEDRKSKKITAWPVRRKKVARTILDSGAGVTFLQEVSGPPKLKVAGKKWQFEDLVGLLPKKYKLTSRDLYKQRGRTAGSQGSRIIYDSSKYSVLTTGYLKMPSFNIKLTRWVPWALFRVKATGEEFYGLSVHLQSGDDKDGTLRRFNMRQKQTDYLSAQLPKLSATGRAVYIGGDFNSTSNTKPYNNVHRTFVANGFYDAFATTSVTGDAFPTSNDFVFPVVPGPFRRDYLMSLGAPAGSYSYVNHVYQSASQFASDHFMQSATMPVNPGPYTAAVRIGRR